MNKISHLGEVLRKRESKETKDKIERIEGKKFSLYFLYDGEENDINSNRAISAVSKYINKNYLNFQTSSDFRLEDLILESNKKIIDLKLSGAHFGIIALYLPREENKSAFFVTLGKSAVYTLSYNQLSRINKAKTNVLLGQTEIEKKELARLVINNSKAPIFMCSDGFINLLANKRKDIVKILNQKDMLSSRAAMNRIMKARNFDNLAYLFIKR